MINFRFILHPITFRRAAAACIVLSALVVSTGFPGEFFGSIKAEGKVVPKGVKIEITSPVKTYAAETDAYGSYRLFVTEKGKCDLKVHFRGQTPSIQVFSYPKSTRYDFTVERKDTLFVLKRK